MAAPVVVAPAINLQHMDLPEGNEGNKKRLYSQKQDIGVANLG
jgi:hypothetical protein